MNGWGRVSDNLRLAFLLVPHDNLGQLVVECGALYVAVECLEVGHDLAVLDVELSEVFSGETLEALPGELEQVELVCRVAADIRLEVQQVQHEHLAVGPLGQRVLHQRGREESLGLGVGLVQEGLGQGAKEVVLAVVVLLLVSYEGNWRAQEGLSTLEPVELQGKVDKVLDVFKRHLKRWLFVEEVQCLQVLCLQEQREQQCSERVPVDAPVVSTLEQLLRSEALHDEFEASEGLRLNGETQGGQVVVAHHQVRLAIYHE